MSEMSQRFEQQALTLFADGPERAPQGLLSASLERTAVTSQRPRLVAVALGAPGTGATRDRRAERRILVLVALAAAALAAAVLLAGRPGPNLVIAPSAGPTPTDAASTSTEPTASSRLPQPSADPDVFRSDLLGFAENRDPSEPWVETPNSWNGHEVGGPEWSMDFTFGTCPDSCGGRVSVSSSTPWNGVIVDWTEDCGNLNPIDCAVMQAGGGRPIRIRGASLDELAARWVERFGPAERTGRDVAGLDAIVLQGSGAIGALIVRGGRTFAITVHADDGSSMAEQRARLDRFLDAMSFPQPIAPIYRDERLGLVVSSLDIGPWARVHSGWSAGPGDSDSVAFWFGRCVDNLCSQSYLSVSHADPETGAIIGFRDRGSLLRVTGSTLRELRSSWTDVYGPSTFESTSVDGERAVLASDGGAHMAVLFMHAGRAVAITIEPGAFLPFEEGPLRDRLIAFCTGAVYLTVP